MQFFGVLGEEAFPIKEALNFYPIMDTVFVYLFRSLLILTGKTDSIDSYIPRMEIFESLCSFLNVEISIHDLCLKFSETDIFVY